MRFVNPYLTTIPAQKPAPGLVEKTTPLSPVRTCSPVPKNLVEKIGLTWMPAVSTLSCAKVKEQKMTWENINTMFLRFIREGSLLLILGFKNKGVNLELITFYDNILLYLFTVMNGFKIIIIFIHEIIFF